MRLTSLCGLTSEEEESLAAPGATRPSLRDAQGCERSVSIGVAGQRARENERDDRQMSQSNARRSNEDVTLVLYLLYMVRISEPYQTTIRCKLASSMKLHPLCNIVPEAGIINSLHAAHDDAISDRGESQIQRYVHDFQINQ